MTGPQVSPMQSTPGGYGLPSFSALYSSLPRDLQGKSFKYFYFPVSILGVAAGQNGPGAFLCPRGFTFASWYCLCSVQANAAGHADSPTAPASISIQDNGQDGFQPNSQVGELRTVVGVIGSSQQIPVWVSPLIVGGTTGINLTVTNRHNATTFDYWFAFHGILIKTPQAS